MFRNLTGYEIDSLPRSYNLTDGHAFRRWFAAEEAIIDRAGQLFKNSNRRQQVEIELSSCAGLLWHFAPSFCYVHDAAIF